MRRLSIPIGILTLLGVFLCAAQPPQPAAAPSLKAGSPQPVLFVLFSRFENHIEPSLEELRLARLFETSQQIRQEFPNQPFKVVCEFSGTVAETLAEANPHSGWLDKVKAAQAAGWIEIGYSGRHEPTYRNHPRPLLNDKMKPEERWLARYEAARKILIEHKDFVTGDLDPARSGGYARVKEVFGEPVYAAHPEEQLGGEAPYLHQMRKSGVLPVLSGFPDPHFLLNLHGFRVAKAEVSRQLAASPTASPELFWDTNALRLSFSSLDDMRMFRTIEGPGELTKLLEKLDRSHVRILQMELVDEERFLNLLPDGSPRLHPLAWAYDHPDQPNVPGGIRAFSPIETVEKSYAQDLATLRWLLGTFIPANQGSRLAGMNDLRRMARTPLGGTVDTKTIQAAAEAFLEGYRTTGTGAPGFVRAGDSYLTAADLFYLLADALAERSSDGDAVASHPLPHIYGPFWIDMTNHFTEDLKVSGAEVTRTATAIAVGLRNQKWTPVPANVIPSTVTIAGKTIGPTQFLRLMAREYLRSGSTEPFQVEYQNGFLMPGMLFPRHAAIFDAANMWTLRPAPLRLD